MDKLGSTTTSARRRCKYGHLIQLDRKNYCDTCNNKSRYWRFRDAGFGADAITGNRETYLRNKRINMARSRMRWGRTDSNFEAHLLRSVGKRLGLPDREAVKTYLRENGL